MSPNVGDYPEEEPMSPNVDAFPEEEVAEDDKWDWDDVLAAVDEVKNGSGNQGDIDTYKALLRRPLRELKAQAAQVTQALADLRQQFPTADLDLVSRAIELQLHRRARLEKSNGGTPAKPQSRSPGGKTSSKAVADGVKAILNHTHHIAATTTERGQWAHDIAPIIRAVLKRGPTHRPEDVSRRIRGRH